MKRAVRRRSHQIARFKAWQWAARRVQRTGQWQLWKRIAAWPIWDRIAELYERIVPAKQRRLISRAVANNWVRAALVVVVAVLLVGDIFPAFQSKLQSNVYAMGSAESLLGDNSDAIAQKLKFDTKQGTYEYNSNYSPQSDPNALSSNGSVPQITASLAQDAKKGVTVNDPVNQLGLTMTPKFDVWPGRQSTSRVVYPLYGGDGWLVYSLHNVGVKEDVLLKRAPGDSTDYSYNLNLGDSYVAKLLPNGSIGVYGNTTLSGNVATGTANDAKLLDKARKNAPKNSLLFVIPTPTITGPGKAVSTAKAKYSLDGSTLTVHATGLKKAAYPLTIDPSIYIETAEKFMQGNNETNIDFDVADTLIQKGKTTGARFNTWNSTTNLNSSLWQQGIAVAGGYVYQVGGQSFNGRIFSTAGTDTYTVPSTATTVTVKVWGGGGGGADCTGTCQAGAGGGGGYAQADLTVSGGQVLTVVVGSGGATATATTGGGGGGGYSAVKSSGGTFLVQAGGGGGGGGGNQVNGGAGGAGGGALGAAGGTVGAAPFLNGNSAGSGTGGTASAGGTAGAAGTNGTAGAVGVANAGGNGGGSGTNCNTSVAGLSGGSGGTGGGGSGGNAATCNGGGGGGGGRFGGAGGGSSDTSIGSNRAAGGGGGGSDLVTGANTVQTQGTGSAPGNSSDSFRNGAGQGGTGATNGAGNTAGTGGIVVITVTGSTISNTAAVNWSKFSTTDGTITSPNPGTGNCSGWCTSSAYDLPAPRTSLSMLAYNGFLYAIGGEDSSCTAANGTGDSGVCKTVYIAKLGANGEPRLWHPNPTVPQTSWVYWYKASDLSSPRSYAGLVAYNNRLYFMGGKTSSSGTASAVSTVEEADVTGNGVPTSWTTTGMAALPQARWGLGIQAYNNHIYVVGGASSLTGTVTPLNTVLYVTLASDGTMSGGWLTSANTLTNGLISYGGNFITIWGAYMYVAGGCKTANTVGYCTSISNTIQLASINADGSLDTWATNAFSSTTPDARMAYSLVAWRGYIYEVGGCSAQDASTGVCTNTLGTINYGVINQDGDASTVNQSSPSGTAPCSGTSPTSCNLTSTIGNILDEAAIMNGYLYIMGGCSNVACSTITTGIAYQAIGSDGSLRRPAACTGTYTDSYCVSSSTLNPGVAAAGTAVFNGRIYLVGGFNTGTNIYYLTINTDGSIASITPNSNNIQTLTASATIPANRISALTYTYAYARANPSSAGTSPGNLYIFGGCMDQAVGCSTYSGGVYKCTLSTTGAVTACTDSGQLQIGTIPNQNGAAPGFGLGAMAGTVYANYIYLIGGLTPNVTDLKTARYAKFDNNNNVVAVSGSSWVEGANQTAIGRRRGAGFGYNGYLYVTGGYDGSVGGVGVIPDIEFAKINVSDGSWGAFTKSSVTINQRWGLTVPVSNSYAYVIGGCTVGTPPSSCTTMTSTIQTFQIYNNDSGTPAAYTTSANTYGTSPNRVGAAATILNGYLYVAGGCTTVTLGACTNAINTVSYTPIDANGGLGTWVDTTSGLPSVQRAFGKLLAAGGTLYYIGGQSSTETDERAEVYYATPSSGNISTWTQATNGLPAARTKFGAAVWNNRLYVVGGLDGNAAATNTVYVSPQLSSGGDITSAWSTSSTGLNVARYGAAVAAYANNLYVFGGNDGTNYLADGQYAQISTSTGNSGSWTYTTSLPTPLAQGEAFAANGYIYVVGGRSAAATCRPITLVAPISANTTIATGNNPTGVGEWYETNAKYTGDRYGNTASYYNGKLYVTGGGCGTATFTYGSPVTQQTALLSQPQVAQYSIMFDTDDDVYPQKWLLNGLDNSVGAYWQLNYRSMSTSGNCNTTMSTFGQNTNVNPVTLGTPGTYTVYDGSGSNIRCGRYFYLAVTIDSSQSYGYPEDVSRGPTITDLTFEFQARAGNRLMHGQGFTGGLKQPDDTPF